jgi:lipase chaperone LimK
VLVRELMAPSKRAPALIRKAVFPKMQVMLALIAAVLELPVEHPAVQRAMAFVALPCIMMVIAPRDLLRQGLPALEAQPDVLLDDMTRYAVAGLHSLRIAYQDHANRRES